ncbi:MAG: YesL family protein [Eubacteriales bacterium]|nr:YesL family protein [Eubacteriales bacterium]
MWDKLSAVFDLENPLMRALGTAGDLIMLNAVTLLCMLPVVTYGASLTARDDVLWHMVRGEESYIVRSFFKSFKKNLKQGSLMGILFLAAGMLLVLEYEMIRAIPAMHSPLFYAMIIIIAGFVLAVGIYSFALLSRYENTVPNTIKNAAVLALAFFPRTVAMLLIVVGFCFLYAAFFQFLFPLLLLMGITFPGYLCALFYDPVFVRIDGRDEKQAEEDGHSTGG